MIRVNSLNYVVSFSLEKGKWFGVKLHSASILAIFLIALLNNSPSITLISGGFISFTAYLYIAFLETQRTPVFFSPLSFYFFWYSIGLGLSAVYFGNFIIEDERIYFSTATIHYESLVKGYIIFLIGSLFLHIGFQLFRPKMNNNDNSKVMGRYSLKTILTLATVSLLYEMLYEYFSIFGGLINFLRHGLIAAVSLLAITSPTRLRLSGGLHLLLIILGCAGIFLMNISTTSKAYMMFAFLPLAWYMIIDRKKIKYLFLLIIFLIPFYFFIVYPVSYELRGQYWSGEGIDKTKAFERVLREDKNSFHRYDIDPVSAYLSRSFDPIAVAYINQQVERYGYVGGETLEYVSYAFIPRVFWPDKPTVTQGTWFAYYTGFAVSPEKSPLSLGITASGELFWNFGIVGVILGMSIIGCCLGGLWSMAGNDPRKSVISMLLYISLLFLMPAMSEAGTVVVTIVILFLAFKVLFMLRAIFFKKTEG